MFKLAEQQFENAAIRVVGVGGGGGNALSYMQRQRIEGVTFISMNTDAQALAKSSAQTTLQLGERVTQGLGAGAKPEVGRTAAMEDREKIKGCLDGADMVFIAAGMGGGTGTGAAPVVAQVARELGALTVAVVTKPFSFEGGRRMGVAVEGIRELARGVDSLITIPNEKLLTVLGGKVSLQEGFDAANDVLHRSVQGISDLITREGLINLDFADVKTVMSEMGMAMMGNGVASGENRAHEAAQGAINNPLLEDVDLRDARGLLVNITAGRSFGMEEFQEVGKCVEALAAPDATLVTGVVFDDAAEDEVRVTLVATGLGAIEDEDGLAPSIGGVTPAAVAPAAAGASGYDGYDQPTVARLQPRAVADVADAAPAPAAETVAAAETADAAGGADAEGEADDAKYEGYLDIPAFLRRQAD